MESGRQIMRAFVEQVFGSVPEYDWRLLESVFVERHYDKDEHILSIGSHCKHLWFMVSGAVRVYELNDGVERSNYFFIDQCLFIDYYSIATGQPSELCITAEEPCYVIAMYYEHLLQLYDKSPLLERIGRIMAERQFVIEFELRRMFLKMDATDRYEYLIRHHPKVFQRFSLKHIASFIGVTPETLSRLRRKK